MAANLRIELKYPTYAVQEKLIKHINTQVRAMMFDRLFVRQSSLLSQIGDLLAKEFAGSAVGATLLDPGTESGDLIGHLGISTSQSRELGTAMMALIRGSVSLQAGKRQTVIRVTAVSRDWNAYRSLPYAQYVSKQSGATIPVSDWLLVNPEIDVGQAEYDIAWKDDSPFPDRSFKNSRSGIAVMIRQAKWGANWSGPWKLPTWVHKIGGENFIEYTLGQTGVASAVGKILLEHVK